MRPPIVAIVIIVVCPAGTLTAASSLTLSDLRLQPCVLPGGKHLRHRRNLGADQPVQQLVMLVLVHYCVWLQHMRASNDV